MNTCLKSLALALGLLSLAGNAPAIDPDLRNALQSRLIPPTVVVKLSQDIDLSDEQVSTIREMLKQAKLRVTEYEMDMLTVQHDLIRELSHPLDTERLMSLFEELTRLERSIKQEHFELWIRVNALLSREQIERVRQSE